MDFHNRKLDQWAQRFVGVWLADDEPPSASSWILMPESLRFDQDEFEVRSLTHVDEYLVALNEHSQSNDAWDLAVYTESVIWAGAYVGEVLRRCAERELHWTTYEDALALHRDNAEELGRRNDFNEFVLCDPSGLAVSPMDAAAAVFVDGYLQSAAQFVAEESAVESVDEVCDAFTDARTRNDESLYRLPDELRAQLTGDVAKDRRTWAQHFQQQGATRQAIDALDESLQAAPFDLITLQELARLHALADDNERALAFYQRALAVAPNDPVTLEHRSAHYWSMGKSELAISDLRTALAAEDTAARRQSLADRFRDLGRFKEALTEYAQGLENARQQDDSGAVAELTTRVAEQHLNLGDASQAMEIIEPLLHQHGAAAPSAAWMCRGRSHAALGNWAAAVADLVAAARLDDQNAEAYARLAWIWATAPDDKVRQIEKGLRAAKKAKSLCGDGDDCNLLVLEALAANRARSGQFDKAVALQQQAVELARPSQRDSARTRLKAYKEKQPWTEGQA